MKNILYSLAVGLAFTVFQVAPVGADDSMLPGTTVGDQGEHPPGEHHDPTMPPPGDHGGIPMCGDVPCPPPGEHQ